MGISKLWVLVQFRLGSHTLPIEQGRLASLAMAGGMAWQCQASPPVPPLPAHRLRYTSSGQWAPLCV